METVCGVDCVECEITLDKLFPRSGEHCTVDVKVCRNDSLTEEECPEETFICPSSAVPPSMRNMAVPSFVGSPVILSASSIEGSEMISTQIESFMPSHLAQVSIGPTFSRSRSNGGVGVTRAFKTSSFSNRFTALECHEGVCVYECLDGDCVLVGDKCFEKYQPCGCLEKIKSEQTGKVYTPCNQGEYNDQG